MSPFQMYMLVAAFLVAALLIATAQVFLRMLGYTPPSDEEAILEELRSASFSRSQRRIAAQLAFGGPAFRNRTVRKLQFLSPDLVSFKLSLDFDVPTPPPDEAAPSVVYVPLVLVHKSKLSRVDLRDETNRAVPIVNQDVEHQLVTLLLCLLWADHFTSPNEALTREAVTAMHRMVAAKSPEDALQHYWTLLAVLPHVQSASRLRDFTSVASQFVTSGQLFAHLEEAEPGRRRILKISFLDNAPWRYTTPWGMVTAFVQRVVANPLAALAERMASTANPKLQVQLVRLAKGRVRAGQLGVAYGGHEPPQPLRNLARDALGLARGVLSRFGITSRPYGGAFSAFHSHSEHLEVEAPPGTVFSGGHLKRVLRGNDRDLITSLDHVPRGATLAHLHCAHPTGDDNPGRREFEVRLRARPRGWLLHAMLSIALVAVLLEAAWYEREALLTGSSSNVVAIALGIGAIAVVYLARPNEHAMTTRLLEGPRLALILAALATLGQITLLALAPGQAQAASAVDGPSFAEDGWIAVAITLGALAAVALNYVGWAVGAVLTSWRTGTR